MKMKEKNEFVGLGESDASEEITGAEIQGGTPQVESDDVQNHESSEMKNDEQQDRPSTPSNAITVRVPGKAPIVFLFGAPSSGKTMTLVRLAKYLTTKDYSISVETQFCDSGKVWEYAKNAENFNNMLNTTTALQGTGRNDFLLVKISDKFGTTVCYILEGAGEDYFPSKKLPNKAQVPFPPYMTGIFGANNKKIWVFLTEPNWKVSFEDKAAYVQRIRFCKRQCMSSKDKAIILYNKIDTTEYVYSAEKVHRENAMRGCNDEYPGLFQIFKNERKWLFSEPYTCKFVPFSTGIFGEVIPNTPQHYDASNDLYPATLWETIIKCIKG